MPDEPSPDRGEIVPPEVLGVRSAPGEDPVWEFVERTLEGRARFWRVVVLGFLCAAALAMIAFALAKAIQPAVLCMLALVVVKVADQVTSRRLESA
ncbi:MULTISPECIES: hypothetical protein [Amycolatopsis]|nr:MULTISPECIES: hypothetical protein [Amycolatopsis]MCF6422586.1 hypothetical protein [Amycolatopsis tucumanensis]